MLASAALLFGIAAVSSFLLTPLVCRIAVRLGLFDYPGPRKMHSKPVPQLGGIGVFASALIVVLAAPVLYAHGVIDLPVASGFLLPLLLGCAVLFCVGLWDDLRHLSVGVKLIGQTVASLIPILWGIRFERLSLFGDSAMDLGYGALPLTLLWVLFITNAWNLIDGLDGLSSGVTIIAAGTFAALFVVEGDFRPALVLLVMVGALAGFLWYNFHPAKIFLGDSGSLLLGYILAMTAVMGSFSESTSWPMAVPLLVLGVPILDTVFVLTRRFIESLHAIRRDREESCFKRIRHFQRLLKADRQHIHYRLLDRGCSHRGAVLTLYGAAVLLSALALVMIMATG